MKPLNRRLFHSLQCLRHENPLGLPRTGSIPRMQRGLPQRRRIKDVGKVVAVSSAKGGVGKSTIAANLALAFARQGHRAGILDTDIFGPSVPTLFNLSGEPRLSQNNQLLPMSNYGVKTMSMGYLVPPDGAVAWRGLMVAKALQQLLHEVDWGGLDVLVLDLPPGTGDVQLSIAQQIVVDGSLVITTPHPLAVADAARGIALFRRADVPVLGLVQNMSLYTCPCCGGASRVFGASDAAVRAACAAHGVELLADLPLYPASATATGEEDARPAVVAEPGGERAAVYMRLAEEVGRRVGLSGGGGEGEGGEK